MSDAPSEGPGKPAQPFEPFCAHRRVGIGQARSQVRAAHG